jgi:hypothetical protein
LKKALLFEIKLIYFTDEKILLQRYDKLPLLKDGCLFLNELKQMLPKFVKI